MQNDEIHHEEKSGGDRYSQRTNGLIHFNRDVEWGKVNRKRLDCTGECMENKV